MAPRFTIAVPTYNRAGFLRPCLAGILRQSFADFELLVCDNASTDDTPAVVKSFSDPRVRYVRHETNLGALANFRYAGENARGEFFVLHQDDDHLHRDFLARCDAATKNDERPGLGPGVTMYASAIWNGDAEQGCRAIVMPGVTERSVEYLVTDTPLVLDGGRAAVRLLTGLPFYHPAVAMRTATLRETGGYDTTDSQANDIVTQARVMLRGTFVYDPRPLGVHVIHGDNAYRGKMSRAFRHAMAHQMYRTLIGDFQKSGVDWTVHLADDLSHAGVDELVRLLRVWVRYDAPPALTRIALETLSSRLDKRGLSLTGVLVKKLGMAKTLQMWKQVAGKEGAKN